MDARNERKPDRSIRRARCLVGYWEDGEFLLQHYLTNARTALAPAVMSLLEGLDDYLPESAVWERHAAVPQVSTLIERLIDRDVLVVAGSWLDCKERLLEATWDWPQSVRHFHFAAQHVHYEDDLAAEAAKLAAYARSVPPPSPYKDYGVPALPLPGSFDGPRGAFWDVLRSRRTRRTFALKPVSLGELSTVLLWTWGKTHEMADPALGPYILRTSPSGGARHPTEVYPVVLRVGGAEPGIYHYSVRRHALELLRTGNFDELVVRLCANQEWVKDAAVVCFMTAVVSRNMWKYKQAQAYRVLQLDAGHLGQTFHFVCTALGLAPFTTAATDDAGIERELGLDGVSEIPLYVAAFGKPRITGAQLHPHRPPT
jgi:SagB-type dehydrogenase family enzyme